MDAWSETMQVKHESGQADQPNFSVDSRRKYEPPRLVVYGTLTDLTRGSGGGGQDTDDQQLS